MTRIFRTSLGVLTIAGALIAPQLSGSGYQNLLGVQAFAQGKTSAPIILIINRNMLLTESKAGKDIGTQAEKLRKTITKELEDEYNGIKKDEDSLVAQQSLLAPEVLRQRAEELQKRKKDFDLHQQVKNREFQASIQNASAEIAKVLEPILTEVIQENSATLLLDQSTVMFASPDIDVTAQVMKKLNDKLKKVKVERVKIDVPGAKKKK